MFPAFLLQILFTLLIVGVALWILSALPGVDATIKQFIRVLIIGCTAVWVIYILMGVFSVGGPYPYHR